MPVRFLAFLLLAAVLTVGACGEAEGPAIPGRAVPFVVETGYGLPIRTLERILGGSSRAGLLAEYFGVPAVRSEEACTARYNAHMCFADLVRAAGTVWLLVDLQSGCGELGQATAVNELDRELYVAVRMQSQECPRGAGTQTQPRLQLITVRPANPQAITTATVVYGPPHTADRQSSPIS